jgi:hypothetical protein
MREVYCELELTEVATPTDGPFIVREPTSTPADTPSDRAGETPIQQPPEAARTRDGEVDPPAAAT